jgi:hypothetical protein
MPKHAFFLFVIAALSGCAGANPQTRDEFRKAMLDGAMFSMVDTYIASRRFDDVVEALNRKTAECFNVNVTMRRTEGGMTTMHTTDEYRTTVRVVGAGSAELTTQFQMKGQIVLQKMPEGGFYSRAVDIERVSPTRTKLTYYGPSHDSGKKAWAAIKQWSEDQSSPCP